MFQQKRRVAFSLAIVTCLVVGGGVTIIAAQTATPVPAGQPQAANNQASPADVIPLKVEVVFSRLQGTRKLSSMPYTLVVSAIPMSGPLLNNPAIWPQSQSTSLRLGVDVFTGRTSTTTSEGKTSSTPEYKYIGADIDCRADYRGAGLYRIYLNLSDTSLAVPAADAAAAGTFTGISDRVAGGVRRFSASNTLSVRDGQTAQFTVGTDPMTGETLRVEVTATAIK